MKSIMVCVTILNVILLNVVMVFTLVFAINSILPSVIMLRVVAY